MTDVFRMKVLWTGIAGMPGTTTLHFDAIPVPANVRAFYESVKAALPGPLNIQVPSAGDIIESSTGELTGAWSTGAAPAPTVCTGSGAYSSVSGMCVSLSTSDIVAGRRVRGRIFLVPLMSAEYDSSGTILNGTRAATETAAQALVTASATHWGIYARPFTPKPGDGAAARPGSFHVITGCVVKDRCVTLRSRRD